MSRLASRRQDAATSVDHLQPTSISAATPPDHPLPPVAIGVGIDTSRFGHHACFLRADLQPAAADLKFVESATGYQQLRQRLEAIAAPHAGRVHFRCRLDLAGRYADNLLAFLKNLSEPQLDNAGLASATFTISCGDPQRNKNYRAAIFGAKKSDPVEAQACARYALTENPKATTLLSAQQHLLGQIASRVESQARQSTRVVNQLHNLLARTFPELALLVHDISAGWVLALLDKYPTRIGQKSLEKMLVDAYRRLPANHLDTIPGFGPVTAAILTAKIVDPHRFADPGKLVGLFGVFPVEASSGIDRDGKSRLPVRMVMCKRGNDIVRRYLWGLDRGLTSSTSKPSCRCSVCSSTWGCWTVCAARAPGAKARALSMPTTTIASETSPSVSISTKTSFDASSRLVPGKATSSICGPRSTG